MADLLDLVVEWCEAKAVYDLENFPGGLHQEGSGRTQVWILIILINGGIGRPNRSGKSAIVWRASGR